VRRRLLRVVQKAELLADQRLSVWKRAGSWLPWSLAGPAVLFVAFRLFVAVPTEPEQSAGCAALCTLLLTALVGYVSRVCFGTVGAAIAGLPGYLVLAGLPLRAPLR
jgi:hypothetical protein